MIGTGGEGYAAPRAWAHRDDAGRFVFPHTDPAGNVVNLYGRAVGDAPKGARHDHLIRCLNPDGGRIAASGLSAAWESLHDG